MKLEWLEPAVDGEAIDDSELERAGVLHRRLPLDAYQGPLDELRAARGYVEQDEVALAPTTENLEAICAKFADEHHHGDDEVRFVLEGEGIFDIRSADDRWMRVTVEAGDLLIVPKGCHHRFLLTDAKAIRCVRLFRDREGWVPHYRAAG